jgi:transcriptional regulator
MYTPTHFQETRPEALISLITQHPFATLVRQTAAGLEAEHIPLLFEAVPGALGKLIGHVARGNTLWQTPAEQEVLVMFQGPSSYISPNWYATKKSTAKVVPTWNYAVVHAHCTLRALQEPGEILPIITRLTNRHEGAQAHPWQVSDAPADYTEKLLAHIVGIELTIQRWQGKWKVSQNQPAENRATVVQGLGAVGDDAAQAMAALVQAYDKK